MLRLGIIGAGIMGERLLRAAVEHAPDVAVISGVWDAAPEALDRIGAAVPGAATGLVRAGVATGLVRAGAATGLVRAGSADEVIASADCVYVATPPASHLQYAEQALAAGKAVFLEKPLAVDPVAAEAFVRRHAGDRVAVNFPFASSLAVQRLQEWIAEGAVGTARGFDVEIGFRAWPRPWQEGAAGWLDGREQGGFTREVGSHFLFLARRLLGPLRLQCSKVAFTPGHTERLVEARLDAGGIKGRLRGSVGQTPEPDINAWTLRGVGAIRLRNWSIVERERPGGAWIGDPDPIPHETARPLVLRRQLEEVARMTQGGPHRLARLDEAFEVQTIVEAILRG